MKAIKVAAVAVSVGLFASLSVSPASAEQQWNNRVKCQQRDADGRVIPTRFGNSQLGWNHFSGKHNIRKCQVVNAALSGTVDERDGARLKYLGVALKDGKQVTIVVIVQYARWSADNEFDSGAGQKIGVITAYCKGKNRCPDWING